MMSARKCSLTKPVLQMLNHPSTYNKDCGIPMPFFHPFFYTKLKSTLKNKKGAGRLAMYYVIYSILRNRLKL